MAISGEVSEDRQVVWRNLCMIGLNAVECVVEFSNQLNRFIICVYDIQKDKHHLICLFEKQANKLMKLVNSEYQTLMLLLDFNKFGKLIIQNVNNMVESSEN